MIGRRVESFGDLERPGDYYLGTAEAAGKGVSHMWFLLPIHEGEDKYDRPTPGSGVCAIKSPPWTFRECGDGSIEVRPSIQMWDSENSNPDAVEVWHGFLDEGHQWRRV